MNCHPRKEPPIHLPAYKHRSRPLCNPKASQGYSSTQNQQLYAESCGMKLLCSCSPVSRCSKELQIHQAHPLRLSDRQVVPSSSPSDHKLLKCPKPIAQIRHTFAAIQPIRVNVGKASLSKPFHHLIAYT